MRIDYEKRKSNYKTENHTNNIYTFVLNFNLKKKRHEHKKN